MVVSLVLTFFTSLFGLFLLFAIRPSKYGNAIAIEKGKVRCKKSKNDVSEECVKGSCSTDVIIVGAGVAGAALAHTLGKVRRKMDGRHVRVIERDLKEPNRIVGEYLQPGGYLKLVELGLQDCLEEIDAQRVLGYALFKDGKSTRLPYPLEKFHSDVAGRGFHNGPFIQKMRSKAATLSKSSVQLEQGTVTSLLEENGTVRGVQYKTKDGQQVKAHAALTIVCDGCSSNLRALCASLRCSSLLLLLLGLIRRNKVEVQSFFVGIVLESCELPYENFGHVIIADPSPIVFYPISSTEVRCLVDVPGQKVPSIATSEMANYLKNVVAPQLPPELHDAFISAIEKGNIRTMPSRSMPANPQRTPGALLVGDSFNMRHAFTGGGMTVALSDVVVLRDLLKPLCNLTDAGSPIASTINTLAEALCKVFTASPDQARKEMRQACFDYLCLRGVCSTGPVGLLSGLYPSPLGLVLHFFAVAVYGVGRLLQPFPSPKRIWIGARLLLSASGIIFPIIKAGVRQMFLPATIPALHRAPPAERDFQIVC